MANSNYGDGNERYKGKSEPWYYPLGASTIKDTLINWEHVWFNKIHIGYDTDLLHRETMRYFREVVEIGGSEYLTHSRFKKYWDEYHNQSN